MWMLVLNCLRLVDMIAMKFVCRRFNEKINDNKRFRICKKFVDDISCKHFLVTGFCYWVLVLRYLKVEFITFIQSLFLRYRFENLLRDISNSNILSHLCGWTRFYNFNNLTII